MSADAVDDLASIAKGLAGVTLVTDPGLAASRAWGLAPPEAEAPDPATVVLDRAGVIRWRRLRDDRGDWPTYAELEAALHDR